jgi:hypothetical protein
MYTGWPLPWGGILLPVCRVRPLLLNDHVVPGWFIVDLSHTGSGRNWESFLWELIEGQDRKENKVESLLEYD